MLAFTPCQTRAMMTIHLIQIALMTMEVEVLEEDLILPADLIRPTTLILLDPIAVHLVVVVVGAVEEAEEAAVEVVTILPEAADNDLRPPIGRLKLTIRLCPASASLLPMICLETP